MKKRTIFACQSQELNAGQPADSCLCRRFNSVAFSDYNQYQPSIYRKFRAADTYKQAFRSKYLLSLLSQWVIINHLNRK